MITLLDFYSTKEYQFLYGLLEERRPWQNISHKKMPTFEEHIKFVDSKPYKHWYLIKRDLSNEYIGAVYISKQDEIGLFLLDKHQHKGFGKIVLDGLYIIHSDIGIFYANIAPLNSASMSFFCNNGFVHHRTILSEDQKHIIQYVFKVLNLCYGETLP